MLTIILSIAGSNPINLDNLTNFAFADPTNKFWLRMQAYTLMTANADYDWGESDDSPTCRQSDIEGYIYIIPEALNGNILTQKNLKILENWEQTITSAPGYENYCYLTTEDCSDDDNKDGYLYTTNGGDCCVSRYTNLDAVSGKGSYNITDENGCYHIVSPLYYFRKYGDASFSDISGTVATIEEKSSSDYTALQKMLDDDFSVNNPKSKIAKMTGYFADPLNRTITRKHVAQGDDDYIGDDYIEYNILSEWMGESYTTWTATLNDKSPVRGFYYFEPGGVDVGDYVTSDLSLAIVGLVLVYVYMMIQIRSVFVASCAMFQILCSFFGGNLVYRYIFPNDDGFGYKNYFTLFEALAIFIIIGIGADDCFVFLDIWKEYETKSVDTVQRLSATWAHAGKAMLVTSLTTFSAFLTNLNSDFSFIQAFGAYCALIVLLNYIMVMTFFPAVVLYYVSKREREEKVWNSIFWPRRFFLFSLLFPLWICLLAAQTPREVLRILLSVLHAKGRRQGGGNQRRRPNSSHRSKCLDERGIQGLEMRPGKLAQQYVRASPLPSAVCCLGRVLHVCHRILCDGMHGHGQNIYKRRLSGSRHELVQVLDFFLHGVWRHL